MTKKIKVQLGAQRVVMKEFLRQIQPCGLALSIILVSLSNLVLRDNNNRQERMQSAELTV